MPPRWSDGSWPSKWPMVVIWDSGLGFVIRKARPKIQSRIPIHHKSRIPNPESRPLSFAADGRVVDDLHVVAVGVPEVTGARAVAVRLRLRVERHAAALE